MGGGGVLRSHPPQPGGVQHRCLATGRPTGRCAAPPNGDPKRLHGGRPAAGLGILAQGPGGVGHQSPPSRKRRHREAATAGVELGGRGCRRSAHHSPPGATPKQGGQVEQGPGCTALAAAPFSGGSRLPHGAGPRRHRRLRTQPPLGQLGLRNRLGHPARVGGPSPAGPRLNAGAGGASGAGADHRRGGRRRRAGANAAAPRGPRHRLPRPKDQPHALRSVEVLREPSASARHHPSRRPEPATRRPHPVL